MLLNFIKGVNKGLRIFIGIIFVITISQALDIQTNVTETVSHMKTMYFTKDGKIMSGDNTSVLLDGEKGTVSLSGSVDILPGKLKDNTIVGNDIGLKTIGGVDIATKSVIETKLQDEVVDSVKLKDRGVMSQDLKDVSIGAANLDTSKMYEIGGYIDNDNTTKKVALLGTSEMNIIRGVEMNATSAIKVKTNMSVGTNPIGTKSLTVNGEINGDADICGGYDHPVYGKQSKVCLGGKPLELGALEAGKWCKVTENKIDCIYDDIFTFDWKISNWGGCSATSSWGSWSSCSKTCGGGTQTRSCVQPNGTQTRTVVCERSDGAIVSDSYCKTAKPPLSQTCKATLDGCGGLTTQSQSCNTQSCITYDWQVGTWGGCGTACGAGTQSRSVVCKGSNGATVADSYCDGNKPITAQNCVGTNCVKKKKILLYFNGGSGFQKGSRCAYYKNIPTSGGFTQRQEKNLSTSYTTDHYDKVVNTGSPFMDLRVDPYPKTITSYIVNGCWFEDHGRYSTNKPKKTFNGSYTPSCSVSMESGLIKLCLSGANPGSDRYVWEVDITYN